MIEKLHYITEGKSVKEQTSNALDACKAGIKWLQFRMKSENHSELKNACTEIRETCNSYNVKFIVNDHVHLAKELDSYGVHIGKNDMSPSEARSIIGSNMIIGCTANSFEDIERVKQYADYIGLGPFRFTSTKKRLSPVLGLEGYQSILLKTSSSKIELPIIAIGGIETNDISELIKTGVHGVAIASYINNSNQKEKIIEQLQNELMYEHTKYRG